MSEKIIDVNTSNQFIEDYRKYGLYILYRRVMADVRDGLKPVQRRILWTMLHDEKAYGSMSNKVKCAAVVGTTIKKYHPHGDTAVYDTMKPMINSFECNYPLIDGVGNFGTFQGDPAAAYRYTEAKLSEFAMDCVLGDLLKCKGCVNWVETFDGSDLEPEYLPVKVPLLLINGSFGIGIGDKAEIQSHNLGEVIDATLAVMDNPDADITLVPDHCMPCEIIDTNFNEITRKGFGHYYIRGIIDIENYNSSKYKNRTALVIKSIHNLLFFETISNAIEKLVDSKKIVQIERCFDESTINQLRYVIILKPGADPNYVREVIYKNTAMEDRIRVNMECVYGVEPMRLPYRAYLKAFIEMRKITKFRIYSNELQNVMTEIHKKEAFIKLLESGEIDNVYRMLKKNRRDDSELIEYLIKKLDITDLQASYIINANLKYISMRYLDTLKKDMMALMARQDEILPKLSDDSIIENEIREELLFIKNKYARKRRCKIIKNTETSKIPEGLMTIAVAEKGFIKKCPAETTMFVGKNDRISSIIRINNTDNLLLFDALGRVHKLPVHAIPFSDKSAGTDIRFLLKKYVPAAIVDLKAESTIIEINTKYRDSPLQNHLITVSKDGYIKKLDLIDFTTLGSSGLIYSRVSGNQDEVLKVVLANDSLDIMVYSDKKAVRVNVKDIPLQKRNSKGTKAIYADVVDGVCVIDTEGYSSSIIVVTEKGYVNKLPFMCIPKEGKDKKGFNVIKLSRNDKVKFIHTCDDSNVFRLTTLSGQILDVPVANIASGSSVSPGIKAFSSRTSDPIIKFEIVR